MAQDGDGRGGGRRSSEGHRQRRVGAVVDDDEVGAAREFGGEGPREGGDPVRVVTDGDHYGDAVQRAVRRHRAGGMGHPAIGESAGERGPRGRVRRDGPTAVQEARHRRRGRDERDRVAAQDAHDAAASQDPGPAVEQHVRPVGGGRGGCGGRGR